MSTWKAVLTEKGEALLAKMTQGSVLDITHAEVGAGTVDASLLKQQTSVATMKQRATIEPVGYPAEGMCALPVTITNEGLSAGYSAWQIGVFANDPDEGTVLFFIAQAEDIATGVPSPALMPSYKTQIIFHVEYGDADSVNVDVNPANAVSQAAMENYVKVNAVPTCDIPNLHIWKKYSFDPNNYAEQNISTAQISFDTGNGTYYSIEYGDDVTVVDNAIVLVGNVTSVNLKNTGAPNYDCEVLRGKFILDKYMYGKCYFVPSNATFTLKNEKDLYINNAVGITAGGAGSFIGYAASKENNTYPANGQHGDGYWYEHAEQLGKATWINKHSASDFAAANHEHSHEGLSSLVKHVRANKTNNTTSTVTISRNYKLPHFITSTGLWVVSADTEFVDIYMPNNNIYGDRTQTVYMRGLKPTLLLMVTELSKERIQVVDVINGNVITSEVGDDGTTYNHTVGNIATNGYTYGTKDLEAGVSPLATGKMYFVYE